MYLWPVTARTGGYGLYPQYTLLWVCKKKKTKNKTNNNKKTNVVNQSMYGKTTNVFLLWAKHDQSVAPSCKTWKIFFTECTWKKQGMRKKKNTKDIPSMAYVAWIIIFTSF